MLSASFWCTQFILPNKISYCGQWLTCPLESNNSCSKQLQFWLFRAGAAPWGDWGETVPPLLTKVIFVDGLKPIRKNWGYEGVGGDDDGDDVTNHIWISSWVSHKWFSKIGL